VLSNVLLDSSRLVEDMVHKHHVGLGDADNHLCSRWFSFYDS
jgi:hypothetical protein